MKDRLATFVSIALLAALVAGTWWAADYAQRAVPQDPPRRLTHEIDSYIEDFVMVRSGPDGIPSSRMEGARLEHYPDDDSSTVTQAKAVSQRADRPLTVATSQRARMDQDGARIVMNGDAHFERLATADRPALDVRSDTMTLYPDEEVATTDQPATIVNGRSRIQGRGMRYDNITRELTVQQRTQVQIAPAGQRPAPPRRPAQNG
ncbi:LPS export ABC transporter periplasmic protein LptC [Pigmentiphaga soli]|uniref:LPS export ABC transporter periplasmic protein LptC n=1 Tax=Pigmentiphaga soli TaxID=1007095 RepID=A0ABP8HD14_9BURK